MTRQATPPTPEPTPAGHLEAELRAALELAARTHGGLVAALRELRLSVLELTEPRLAELLRCKGRPRA